MADTDSTDALILDAIPSRCVRCGESLVGEGLVVVLEPAPDGEGWVALCALCVADRASGVVASDKIQ